MFDYINGTLEYRTTTTCVLDCGGIGYKLTVSMLSSEALSQKLGQKVKLFTYLAVREDGIELFGFASSEERLCFNQLTSVSGVGPKAAMSILSVMTPDDLAAAVCTDDAKSISRAQGIGTKTAQRIVLELKDKMAKELMTALPNPSAAPSALPFNAPSGKLAEATQALMVLGYDRNTILAALKGTETDTLDTPDIIKLVLKKLTTK